MKTLLFVIAITAATIGATYAQVVILQPLQPGAAGTLRNPYVLYEQGMPTMQFNTPQLGTVPPSQPLLTAPLGRPLGSDWGDPFGGHGVLGRD